MGRKVRKHVLDFEIRHCETADKQVKYFSIQEEHNCDSEQIMISMKYVCKKMGCLCTCVCMCVSGDGGYTQKGG